ncbi:TonB-dependent receptor-like protein [Sphingobium sp. SYK-6]|uniref:TonB-dependent receptor n=1 Tax=Sphingobium sp. (strain NBRC 103272 / SYK-6) TaxID=627192 RepID=UPI0002277EB5|nr:TonB-dependent receptor [Sphingobium sp. SYK-6]BAK68425.1 TonB-dependent receptor-like protein [Sphingobium sp. SYK-6]
MTIASGALRLALLTSACTCAPLFAQPVHELPPVEVEAGPGPAKIATAPLTSETVSRDRLRRLQSQSSDVAGLLTRLPGVSANTGGGFSAMPVLRGLSEQRFTILVDGTPIDMACPNDMNTPLSYTDPQTVNAIQVITGVSPVSMGGDSIGGVISVSGPAPRFATDGALLVTGEASAFYRSNGDGFGGGTTLTVAGRTLSATYTGSYTEAGNYAGGDGKGTVRSTEYAKTDHALALAWQSMAGLFELKGGYHFSPYEGFPNQYMDMTSNKSWFLSGRYQGSFDWGSVDFRADYRDTDHEMNFLADKGGTADGGMPMNTQVHSASTALKIDMPVSTRDSVRAGAEFHHQWLDDYWPPVAGSMMMGPNRYINVNAAHRDRIGAFGEWERHWSEALSTLFGVRYDRVSMNTGDVQPYSTSMMNMDDAMAANAFNARDRKRIDNNWSASALVSYAPSDLVALELGYAHKVRSPNLYERYAWGRGSMSSRMIGWYGDGNGYVGNMDLKPERADTVSAALALEDKQAGWSLKVAPYYTHVDDYIDATPIKAFTDMMGMPSGFVQLGFVNQKAEFYGIDVSGMVRLREGKGTDGTAMTFALSYVHGDNLSDGGALYRQMPLNLKMGLEHRQGAFEAGVDLDWVAEKKRVDITRNEPRTDDYALVTARVAYTVGAVRLSVEAENLFDAGYALPLGGLSLGDYIAGGPLRPVPGRGRSFNIGLSTRF